MKRIIVIIICLLLLGGAIVTFLLLYKKDDNTLDNPPPVEDAPTISSTESILLICGGPSYKITATKSKELGDAIKYLSLNSVIASVDANGNVTPLMDGKTTIKSYFNYDGDEVYDYTQVQVVKSQAALTIKVLDEEVEVDKLVLNKKYKVEAQSDLDFSLGEVSLLASDNVTTDGVFEKNGTCFSCNIYATKVCDAEISLKFEINADNKQLAITSEKIILSVVSPIEIEDDSNTTPPQTPSDEQDKEPNDPTLPPSDENTGDEGEDNNNQEGNGDADDDNSTDEENPILPTFKIIPAATLGDGVTFNKDTNTYTFSKFKVNQLEAFSYELENADKTYTIKAECSGESIQILEASKAMIGFCVKKQGESIVKLYAVESPSLFILIKIVVQ